MLKLIGLSLVQSMFLAAAQVLLKLSLEKMGKFSWTWKFFRELFVNWHLLASGISAVTATFLWAYILKNYELSLAYPLISISYIFGMFAAIFIFHESVPTLRWVGVLFIMIGVVFLTRPT